MKKRITAIMIALSMFGTLSVSASENVFASSIIAGLNDLLDEAESDETADQSEDFGTLSGLLGFLTNENDSSKSSKTKKNTVSYSGEMVDGMHKEFKEAMDSYEEFMDEYIELLEKYENNPTDAALIVEYADYLTKFADVEEKFEAWDEEEMNDAEVLYYTEVQLRVVEKLEKAS